MGVVGHRDPDGLEASDLAEIAADKGRPSRFEATGDFAPRGRVQGAGQGLTHPPGRP
jgi:hypothetical protein